MGKKRCATGQNTEKSTKNVEKRRRIACQPIRITELPPIIINQIIGNLPLSDHTNLRSVCKYFHEEIEFYWRSQKSITIPKLCQWFPHLEENKWKFENLVNFSEELSAVFNLMRVGNLQILNFEGLRCLHWPSFVKIIERYTNEKADKILENVRELNLRGCLVSPKSMALMSKSLPSLRTIIVDQNVVIPKNLCWHNSKSCRFEMYRLKSDENRHNFIDHRVSTLPLEFSKNILYISQLFEGTCNIFYHA